MEATVPGSSSGSSCAKVNEENLKEIVGILNERNERIQQTVIFDERLAQTDRKYYGKRLAQIYLLTGGACTAMNLRFLKLVFKHFQNAPTTTCIDAFVESFNKTPGGLKKAEQKILDEQAAMNC